MAQFKSQKSVAAYLSRYRVAAAEADDIELRIKRARDEMKRVKGVSYEGRDIPSGTHTRDLSDYMAHVDDLIREWQADKKDAVKMMEEVKAAISTVRHDCARRVLMLHFVDGYTFEQIAEKIPSSLDSVYRWRRLGLSELKDNIK